MKDLLKKKKVTGTISLGSFVSGSYFIKASGITGNIISTEIRNVELISLIGIALIICSILLLFYTIKK